MACRSVKRGEEARAKMQKELATSAAAEKSGVVRVGTLEVKDVKDAL